MLRLIQNKFERFKGFWHPAISSLYFAEVRALGKVTPWVK
jgi:hypothetical protein